MDAGTIVRTPMGLGRVVCTAQHHLHGRVVVVRVGGGNGVHGFEPHEVEIRRPWGYTEPAAQPVADDGLVF